MNDLKHLFAPLLLILTALGSGCTKEKQGASTAAAPTVTIARAVTAIDSTPVRYSGLVEAAQTTALSFPISGTVAKILVAEGQRVSAGEILAVLDTTLQSNNLLIALAKSNQAEDMAKRLRPLRDSGSVSEAKMIDVETGREQAELSVAQTRKMIADAVLRAPSAGVVAKRMIEPGQTALPGVTAFTVADLRTMLVKIPVPEKEIARIRESQPATIAVEATGASLTGTVSRIGVEADPLARTYDVRIAIGNPDNLLRPGMIATASIALGAVPRLTIPVRAVTRDPAGHTCVFVADTLANTVQRRVVNLSGFGGEQLQVRDGLTEGESVVVQGVQKLHDGMSITIAPVK